MLCTALPKLPPLMMLLLLAVAVVVAVVVVVVGTAGHTLFMWSINHCH